jgi:hypothetical protein
MKFGCFKSLWGSAKLPYWRQRADFTAADFPAATFNDALAALRGHDWAAELDLMDELEAAGHEFCLPGIGFVLETGCVLHICPNRDGTATSFYLYGGESLHREGVSPEEQKRLLKLLYKQDRVELAKAFDDAASSRSLQPKWRALLQALWQIARPAIIVILAMFTILNAFLLFVAVVDGLPLGVAIGRLLTNAPLMLLIMVAAVAAFTAFLAPIFLAIALFEKNGWILLFEGQDHTRIILLAGGSIVLVTLFAIFSDKWADLPIDVGYIAGFYGAFCWPIYVMGRFRRQQDCILDKIRSHYVLATTALMAGTEAPARERLRMIRNLEAHWRLGASVPVRVAHISYAAVTNIGLAFFGQVIGYHVNSYPKPVSLSESIEKLLTNPWLLAVPAAMAVLFSMVGLRRAVEVRSRPWSEFYGNQLESALRAGRGVENAPQHELPPLPEGVSARELLGLNLTFTKAELRSAWLRLARELHPDRWIHSGQAVRQMKEAALKRVNAARDELAAQAL